MIGQILRSLFPNVLAAVEAREKHRGDIDGKDLWAIGDALNTDFLGPQKIGEKIKDVAKELKQRGYKEYGSSYLYDLYETARDFSRNRRNHPLPFFVYREAGSPDFLDWIVEERGVIDNKGHKLSGRDVRAMRQRWKQLEKQKRKQLLSEAKDAARHATTPQAKKKADDAVEELTGMPEPTGKTRPDRESVTDLRIMEENLDLSAQSKAIIRELQSQRETIDNMKGGIHPDFIDALEENYKEADKTIQQIRQRIEKSRLKIFKTIQGGKAS